MYLDYILIMSTAVSLIRGVVSYYCIMYEVVAFTYSTVNGVCIA